MIDKLTENKVLNTKIRKSLRREIRSILKLKSQGTSVENITLNDLINYFDKRIWSEHSFKNSFNVIRENRNVIHSFKSREIMNWNEFKNSLDIYLTFLQALISTMSKLENIVDDIIGEFLGEMSTY